MIFGVVRFISLIVIIANLTKNTGEIQFGTLGADMEVSARSFGTKRQS
jgi:hypothetical protein